MKINSDVKICFVIWVVGAAVTWAVFKMTMPESNLVPSIIFATSINLAAVLIGRDLGQKVG